jgi:mono/diheme cytochrome c family protein
MNRLLVVTLAAATIAAVAQAPRALRTHADAHAPKMVAARWTAYPEPTHTVWDSVYSAGQATHGDSLYRSLGCVKCHGATLAGGDDGSPLTGKDFSGNWDGQTLEQLFDQIRNSMPPDNPKSVPRDQVADLVAYVLSKNQFPAGGQALTDSVERLRDIKVVFSKP